MDPNAELDPNLHDVSGTEETPREVVGQLRDDGFEGKMWTPCCRILIDGFPPKENRMRHTCRGCGKNWLYEKVIHKGIIDITPMDERWQRI